jgi:hypothetical protein
VGQFYSPYVRAFLPRSPVGFLQCPIALGGSSRACCVAPAAAAAAAAAAAPKASQPPASFAPVLRVHLGRITANCFLGLVELCADLPISRKSLIIIIVIITFDPSNQSASYVINLFCIF